jgi:hypothetical protein
VGLAAQVAAWGARWPKNIEGPILQAGRPVVTYPATLLRIAVELYIGGSWVDIAGYVRYRPRIKVYRGRRDEQTQASAAYCNLTLSNVDGRFSPRNTAGPYFGLFGRNTKIRISVDPGSGFSTRFTGYVSEWPPRWDAGSNSSTTGDRWVSIRADGILRRLGQGTKAALSSMRRYVDANPTNVINYWPLEGGQKSSDLFDTIDNRPTQIVAFNPTNTGDVGEPRFGSVDLADGSDSVVDVSGNWRLDLYPRPTVVGGNSSVRWAMNFGSTKFDSAQFGNLGVRWDPHYFATHLKVDFYALGDSTFAVKFIEARADFSVITGPTTVLSGSLSNIFDGQPRLFTMTFQTIDNNHIGCQLFVNGTLVSSGTYLSVAPVLATAPIWRIGTFTTTGASSTLGCGHVIEYQGLATDDAAAYSALIGHVGELPTTRFLRICAEEDIDAVVDELVVDSEGMGAQGLLDPLGLLRECEATNEGFLDETVDGRLRLSSRTKRYNEAPDMIVDYPTQVMAPFEPTDDDLLIRNDWTIIRRSGLTGRYQKETGALNVSDPAVDPQGVGRYESSETLSLSDDSAAIQHAAWRVRKGTVDEPRFPRVCFNFARNPELIPAWLVCDTSSRYQATNPPEDVGSVVDQVIEGMTEYIDPLFWEAEVSGSPFAANTVSVFDTVLGRLDCDGTTLFAALDTTSTSLSVAISDDCVWTHSDGDFAIVVDGEEMLVTAVSAAGGAFPFQTQTLTVTRSYNGTVASHLFGAEVHIRDGVIAAL